MAAEWVQQPGDAPYYWTAQNGSNSFGFPVQVPDVWDLCIVCNTGYRGVNDTVPMLAGLNFVGGSGLDFTIAERTLGWGVNQHETWYLKSTDPGAPSSGNQTLTVTNNNTGNFGEGLNIGAFFLNNVDISGDPIRDTDKDDGTPQSWTSKALEATPLDIIIMSSYEWRAPPDVEAGPDQIEIYSLPLFRSCTAGVGWKQGVAPSTTVQIGLTGQLDGNLVPHAIVFKGREPTGPSIELYKPSWPIELLHRAAYREPEIIYPKSKILSSRMIRGVK